MHVYTYIYTHTYTHKCNCLARFRKKLLQLYVMTVKVMTKSFIDSIFLGLYICSISNSRTRQKLNYLNTDQLVI